MTLTRPDRPAKEWTPELLPPVKRRPFWPWIMISLSVLIAVAFYFKHNLAPAVDPHKLFVSGRLEGYETNLSPKIGGRVAFIKYREGEPVEPNELVAQLNDADLRAQLAGAEAKILQAQAAIKMQRNQIKVVEAQISAANNRLTQSREESAASINQGSWSLEEAQARYKQAQSQIQQAKVDLSLAVTRLERYTSLLSKGAISKDDFDQAKTNYDNCVARLDFSVQNEDAGAKAVKLAQSVLAQNSASRFVPSQRQSEIDALTSQLDAANRQLEQAQNEETSARANRNQIKANLDYLTIASPIHGVVTARPVEPGSVLAPGQTILTVLDYDKIYMRAFVPEASIAKVRLGQKASVYLDAMPKTPFSAKVIEVDPEGSFTPENIYFKDDRVKQVFGIKLGLDSPGGFAKPGMPADANISI